MGEVQVGVYRHFKGALYHVLGVAQDANLPGTARVVYLPLAPHSVDVELPLLVRFRSSTDGPDAFTDVVTLPDGTRTARFTYLGPQLTADMLACRQEA